MLTSTVGTHLTVTPIDKSMVRSDHILVAARTRVSEFYRPSARAPGGLAVSRHAQVHGERAPPSSGRELSPGRFHGQIGPSRRDVGRVGFSDHWLPMAHASTCTLRFLARLWSVAASFVLAFAVTRADNPPGAKPEKSDWWSFQPARRP